VYALGRVICYPIRLLFRIRTIGTERVPRRGPVLLAVNHVSLADPLLVLWLGERTRRKIRFLAMAELWHIRVLKFFLVHTHQIPVARASIGAVASLQPAETALREGACVCIFPEGEISDNLELQPGKTGIARLAALTGVPVTPVGVWGTQRVHAKGRGFRFPFGVAISLVVGQPVAIARDDDLIDATNRVMEAVAGCVATARAVYAQSPRPGEDAWWARAPESAVARPTARDKIDQRWS
jgi:1-acyl-sn-glycerol-3-phosphate acyltransferase